MNRYFLILMILFNGSKLFSQTCKIENDNFLFIEIDIRSNARYSVSMSGVMNRKGTETLKINKNNPEQFIKDFYRISNYVPYSLIYKRIIKTCPNLQINDDYGQQLMNHIYKYSKEKTIILKSGDNVFVRISEINADFVKLNKYDFNWPTVSNEYSIGEIDEIDTVFVPVKLHSSKKPSRKTLKRIFD